MRTQWVGVFTPLAGLLALFLLMGAPILLAVTITPARQAQTQAKVETFFGTIIKSNGQLILSDSATKSKYALDDRDKKANRYEGMTVKVTGIIDVASNLIHVETIQQIV